VSFRSDSRGLDIAIKVVAVFLAVAAIYLVYTYASMQLGERRSAPTSQAIRNLIEAVEEDPQNVQLRLTLAEAFAAAGQEREAAEQFNAALEIAPDNPNALAGLALLSMFQEEWETAEEYWLAALDELEGGQFSGVDQRLEQAYHQMGATLMQQGRYEEAAEYLQAALRIRRSAADTHYLLAVTYRELGSQRNHRSHLESALAFDPVMPEANYDLAFLLLEDGDPAGAAELFRVSVDNAPPSRTEPMDELRKLGPVQDRLAEARRLETSDPGTALTEARIARAIDPQNVDAARLVATLYERTWDRDNAVEAWGRVLELVPDDTEASAALDRLKAE
jgi:Tfp pilus assembly protein PilF